MRVRKAIVAGAVVILSILCLSPALANSLVNSSPISGSSVASPPSAVTITVKVPLLDVGNSVMVTDPKGTRVDDGALTVDGVNVIIGLKPLTVTGTYKVTYSLLANNQVPLQGSYNFTYSAPNVISSPSAIATSTGTANSSSSSSTSIFVIGLLFAAFFVLLFLVMYAIKIFKK